MQIWLPRGDFDHGAEFREHVNASNATEAGRGRER